MSQPQQQKGAQSKKQKGKQQFQGHTFYGPHPEVDEQQLPTIQKLMKEEDIDPETLSKVKSWESRRHHGEIPAGSPASELEHRHSQKHKGEGGQRVIDREKHAFKQQLYKEEEDLLQQEPQKE
ncbi:hypothetical protein P9112_013915 [Eukaryota sp. TZLM1-RC]